MKYVHQTWYRLADGTQADPNDVALDEKGVLRHKNGVPVAMRENGSPMTCGARDAEEKAPPAKDRELKAAGDGKKYKTR